MKKAYITPYTKAIAIKAGNILTTSKLERGADMDRGSADSRRGRTSSWDDEEDY